MRFRLAVPFSALAGFACQLASGITMSIRVRALHVHKLSLPSINWYDRYRAKVLFVRKE